MKNLSCLIMLLLTSMTTIITTSEKKYKYSILPEEKRNELKLQKKQIYTIKYEQALAENSNTSIAHKFAMKESTKFYEKLCRHTPEYRKREREKKLLRNKRKQLISAINLTISSDVKVSFNDCFKDDTKNLETDLNLRKDIDIYINAIENIYFKTVDISAHEDLNIATLTALLPELSYHEKQSTTT